ncbi:MAG: hypothetical protein FJ149_01745 [Euryarchaeota archaeon]|nr:hypothetical protein [Euryarchaeota archaeon]
MAPPSIRDESRSELLALFDIVNARERELDRPTTLLIGGWAVYTYNAYFGSVDIDIVTTSDMKRRLATMLRKRGFRYYKDAFEDRRLCRQTAAGPVQVDFFNSRTPYNFEGRKASMKYEILYDGFERNPVGGVSVPVPSRTGLLVTKMKAAWDRGWRLENAKSADPEYETRKLVKDNSDIIALADREKGGKTLDLNLLGGLLDRYQFLKAVLERVPASTEAAELYGIPHAKAKTIIAELVGLL